MATTVNTAFDEFMKDIVNLDPDVVSKARESRDNLLENIAEFDEDGFFDLYEEYNVPFGSFARKTKCREPDDIDLMIGIAANGATYSSSDPRDDVHITASTTNQAQKDCTREDGTLNSTQVINKFKSMCVNIQNMIYTKGRGDSSQLVRKRLIFWQCPLFPYYYRNEPPIILTRNEQREVALVTISRCLFMR